MDDTILRVDDIQKFYGNKGNLTKAVDFIVLIISVLICALIYHSVL